MSPSSGPESGRTEQGARRAGAPWAAAFAFFAGFYLGLLPLEGGTRDGPAALAAFAATALLSRSWLGGLADRWGGWCIVAWAGRLLGASALVAGMGSPLASLAGAVARGVAYVAFTSGYSALVAEATHAPERAHQLARAGAPTALAGLFVPLLAQVMGPALTPGLRAAAGLLAGALVVAAARSGAGGGGNRIDVGVPRRCGNAIRNLAGAAPGSAISSSAAALACGALFAVATQAAPAAAGSEHHLALTGYGVGMVAVRLVAPLRRPTRRALVTGLAVTGAGLATAAWPGALAALIGPVLAAVGLGLVHPVLLARAMEAYPAGWSGRAGAWFYHRFDAGMAGGGLALAAAGAGITAGRLAVLVGAALAAVTAAALLQVVQPGGPADRSRPPR